MTSCERLAREKVLAAIHFYARAYGQAQWTHGYRTGRPDREKALLSREMQEWETAGERQRKTERALTGYRRALLAAQKETPK